MSKNNEAAKLVTGSLLGIDFKTVLIGSKAYTIYPPTLKIISRTVNAWSDITLEEKGQTSHSVIASIPSNYMPIIKGLSYLIVGKAFFWKWKALVIQHRLEHCLPEELYEAVKTGVDLMGKEAFFQSAVLCKSVTKMAANPK